MTTNKASHLEFFETEGGLEALDSQGQQVIEIFALQDRDKCAKWGERYTPGREWCVFDATGDTVARGRSSNIRAAKRQAMAIYNQLAVASKARELGN